MITFLGPGVPENVKTRTAVGLQAPHATPVLRSKSHAVSKSGLMSVSEQLRAYPYPYP